MKKKKNTDQLEPDTFYHIYNRGINGTSIFLEDKNYAFFLTKYAQYINPVADTYAYCLLKNHFHFLIRTKPVINVEVKNLDRVIYSGYKPCQGCTLNPVNFPEPGQVISKKFANLFNSYSQSFNKMYSRTGGLFETLFRRIKVTTEEYFTRLVYYIHFNPQKHGFVDDFREYPYSSYSSHLSNKETKLKREEVFKWFGDKEEYKRCHEIGFDIRALESFDL